MRIVFDTRVKIKSKVQQTNISKSRKTSLRPSSPFLIMGLGIAAAVLNFVMFSGGSNYKDDSFTAKILLQNPELNSRLAEQISENQFASTENNAGHENQQQHNLFVKTAQAQGNLADDDLGDKRPFEYEVQGGDTLSNIAERYELKLNTILWANNLTAKSVIRPGQKITLLPVDGVLYTVRKGDTVSKIAVLHGSDAQKIIDYNEIDDVTKIHVGDAIIIPDGQPLPKIPARPVKPGIDSGAPPSSGVVGKLLWPTSIRNISQGYSITHRGMDIANGGQPPIYASHSGTVEFAGTSGDWGNTILIRGDDGLVTRYSHNAENYLKTGNRVEAGQTIAKVGNTGRVRGATGLHLDFRVYKNGIAVNPLNYLK